MEPKRPSYKSKNYNPKFRTENWLSKRKRSREHNITEHEDEKREKKKKILKSRPITRTVN